MANELSPTVCQAMVMKVQRGPSSSLEARRQQVPAFRILSDLTLLDVAAKKPRDGVELLEIGGIGPSRLEKYGTRILRIVKDPL
jgi:superfamily II DNA helicase RecQ